MLGWVVTYDASAGEDMPGLWLWTSLKQQSLDWAQFGILMQLSAAGELPRFWNITFIEQLYIWSQKSPLSTCGGASHLMGVLATGGYLGCELLSDT